MIREIVNVAEKYYGPGWPNKSFYNVLKETGCLDSKIKIDEKDIYDELIKCPECIKQWVNVSADQRDGNSWFFVATTNGRYSVGRLNNEAQNRPYQETIFTDGYKACANFLMHLIGHYKEIYSKNTK